MTAFKNFFKNLVGKTRYQNFSQQFRPLKLLIHPKHDQEVKALCRLISHGNVVLDIGANYGQYTRVLSKLVSTEGRVFAFEPCSATFMGLKRTIQLLRLNNVVSVQTALSKSSGISVLKIPIKQDGTHGVSLAFTGTDTRREFIEEKITTISLDEFAEKHELRSLSFIKCDVEGAEFQVLSGGEKTLRQWHPSILLEINLAHLSRHNDTPERLEKFMLHLGYHFFKWEDNAFHKVNTIANTFGTANYFLMAKE